VSKRKETKRNIFAELIEGVRTMGEHRAGKVTLRTHSLPHADVKESPGAEFFVTAREKFNVSRAVWANMLRVSPRTVEKWEQGGQVSPLAATFVELVSRYPDTIERLQTLPKRVSRAGNSGDHIFDGPAVGKSTKQKNGSLPISRLRERHRPKRIRVLFVGEAPPAGQTFFYAENSQVYRHLEEALRSHLGSPDSFLKAFRERGYFLDDLTLEPIGTISPGERKRILKQNIPRLAQRIAEYQPQMIVTILKRIFPYVEEARSLAGVNVPNRPVSFPGNGQQVVFRREMAELLPDLP